MDSNNSKNNNEKTPYEVLGVDEGASFEDIQRARDIKVKEAGEDLILKAKIESSFDKLLMGSLKARQSGNVSFAAESASQKEKQVNQILNNNFPLLSKIKKINNGYFVNSGATHYVEFVDDLNKVDIIQEVTKIKSSEFYDYLPFNINFIQKENNLIYIRTFEKGVERETLSCGTGAVASSVVCSKIFEDNFPLIKARGGDLRVNYKKKRDLFYDITLSSNPLMEYNSYLKIISS